MSATFQLGDVVFCKCDNSPAMTVEYVGGDVLNCVWFTSIGQVQREQFAAAALVPAGKNVHGQWVKPL